MEMGMYKHGHHYLKLRDGGWVLSIYTGAHLAVSERAFGKGKGGVIFFA